MGVVEESTKTEIRGCLLDFYQQQQAQAQAMIASLLIGVDDGADGIGSDSAAAEAAEAAKKQLMSDDELHVKVR